MWCITFPSLSRRTVIKASPMGHFWPPVKINSPLATSCATPELALCMVIVWPGLIVADLANLYSTTFPSGTVVRRTIQPPKIISLSTLVFIKRHWRPSRSCSPMSMRHVDWCECVYCTCVVIPTLFVCVCVYVSIYNVVVLKKVVLFQTWF